MYTCLLVYLSTYPYNLPIKTTFSAALQALFVTFLWATSWVLIKLGLHDIPALTFAGLRYSLALLILLPLFLARKGPRALRGLSRREWLELGLLGLLYYAVTQGAQFVSLALLPAVTASLLLNLTSLMVALLALVFLSERPTRWQWVSIGINLAGVLIYFYPVSFPESAWLGLIIALVGVLANALSAVLGRRINRARTLSPLAVTTVSMGIGSLLLLSSGLALQGLPPLNLTSWAIIAWLAVVNTAFAFTLWNRTLRTLTAIQSSLINSTMLVQIALLAWFVLGESLTGQQILGMGLALAGAVGVQVAGHRPQPRQEHSGSAASDRLQETRME